LTKKKLDPEYVRDISERIYRRKLDNECGAGSAAMVDKAIAEGLPGPDGRDRMSIRARAAAYDKLTRLYVQELLP
jgi:hypothetical protein